MSTDFQKSKQTFGTTNFTQPKNYREPASWMHSP